MPLNIESLFSSMFAAAKTSAMAGFKTAEPFAKTQFTNIATQIVGIEEQLADGSINQDQAALLFDMQKHASRIALLTIEGIGLMTAENIINSALGAIAGAVNTALGFALL